VGLAEKLASINDAPLKKSVLGESGSDSNGAPSDAEQRFRLIPTPTSWPCYLRAMPRAAMPSARSPRASMGRTLQLRYEVIGDIRGRGCRYDRPPEAQSQLAPACYKSAQTSRGRSSKPLH